MYHIENVTQNTTEYHFRALSYILLTELKLVIMNGKKVIFEGSLN